MAVYLIKINSLFFLFKKSIVFYLTLWDYLAKWYYYIITKRKTICFLSSCIFNSYLPFHFSSSFCLIFDYFIYILKANIISISYTTKLLLAFAERHVCMGRWSIMLQNLCYVLRYDTSLSANITMYTRICGVYKLY